MTASSSTAISNCLRESVFQCPEANNPVGSPNTIDCINAVDYKSKNYLSVENMYGEDDLSSCPLFKGGYINFGYWKGIDILSNISVDQRIESAKNLYEKVFQWAALKDSDEVLEVGSGLGFGCALTISNHKVKKVTGLDFSADQVSRAKQLQSAYFQSKTQMQFIQGAAESLPFAKNSFSKVYSVEAAQHFSDIYKFLSESHSVLKKDGKLVVTTFFSTSPTSSEKLSDLIPTIQDGIDKAIPIDTIKEKMVSLGFKDIKIESIGEKVWLGFDKWIHQCEMGETWNKNWLFAFKENLVDYYIIEGTK